MKLVRVDDGSRKMCFSTLSYSNYLTDIFTGWVETAPVLGKAQQGILAALDVLVQRLPFELRGIDSDNGNEFINDYLVQYCREHHLQFTRGRLYQKQDNAHIEQKNWTHVRKLFGWQRCNSRRALDAMNALYAHNLGVMMNWFQSCVKLECKERVGSRILRRYAAPKPRSTACRDRKHGECCRSCASPSIPLNSRRGSTSN